MMKRKILALLTAALMILPAFCLALSAADTLPAGFVPMEKIFRVEDGDGTQPTDYGKVDGFYLVLEYITSSGTTVKGYRGDALYGKDKAPGEYYTVSQTISGYPSLTYTRDKNSGSASVTGTFDYSQQSTSFGLVLYKSELSLTISNVSFEDRNCYADISGSLNMRGGTNGEMSTSESVTFDSSHIRGTYKLGEDRKTYYIHFTVSPREENHNLTYATLWFRIAGVLPKGTAYSGITQNAEANPGEDGGVSVPAAIVIGIVGGGAAIAGAAAAGISNNGGSDSRKRAYRMYVQKDFGDAIRRRSEPVRIRARMAESDGAGAEHDRSDLTARISVSAAGMTLHGASMAGRYMEATVSVPEENRDDTARITFEFTGEGGVFANTVIFRLTDGPALKFLEEDETAGGLVPYHNNCGIDAIPGDGFTYTRMFMISDAPSAPKLSDISVSDADGFEVGFEQTNGAGVYRMKVKNNTAPEPDHDIFAEKKEKNFEINVNVEGEKEPVKGYVTVSLYPEGISVRSSFKDRKGDLQYIRVQSYEKEYAGDLDRKWQVSEMQFILAVKGRDKAVIDPKDAKYTFGKIKGSGGKGTGADKEQAVADKYEYRESFGMAGDKFTYTFEPSTMLWEPDNGSFFMTVLPVSCEYGGKSFKAEVPMRLKGKEIDPMEEWEREYEKTRQRIAKFSLPEKKDYNLKQLAKVASNENGRISVTELRLMSKDILRAYMEYWTTQHEKDQWTADALDWAVWGLEWIKWIGDCAFSFLINAYAGPVADAVLSPAKDVLTSLIGEVGVNIVWGTKFDPDKLEVAKALKTAGDNIVGNWTTDAFEDIMKTGLKNPTNIKYACAIIAGYFVYASVNNYLQHMAETGESDFYGALMGGFKDLTVTGVKIAAGIMFKKWLASDYFKTKLGPKLENFMQKYFGDNLTNQEFNLEQLYNDSQQLYGDLALKGTFLDKTVKVTRSAIVEKYLTELCGEGAGWIHDNPDDALGFVPDGAKLIYRASVTIPFETGAAAARFVIDLDLFKVLTNTSCGLFGWMYDLFFSGVPTATSIIEAPKDPQLPPMRNSGTGAADVIKSI